MKTEDDSLVTTLQRIKALTSSDADEQSDLPPLLTTEELLSIARNADEETGLRKLAIQSLHQRLVNESEISEFLLNMMEDPNDDIAQEVISCVPPYARSLINRLRQLLFNPREILWKSAALALSRKKDDSILPVVLDWITRGDRIHRRIAMSCLPFLYIPEEHLKIVEKICELGPLDQDDETFLIEALRVAESRVLIWRRAMGIQREE